MKSEGSREQGIAMKENRMTRKVHFESSQVAGYSRASRFSFRHCMYSLLAVLLLASSADAGRNSTPVLSLSSVTANSVALRWTDPGSSELNWTVERTDVAG